MKSRIFFVLLKIGQRLSSKMVNAGMFSGQGQERERRDGFLRWLLGLLYCFSKRLKKFLRGQMESIWSASWLVSVWSNRLAGTLIHERSFYVWVFQFFKSYSVMKWEDKFLNSSYCLLCSAKKVSVNVAMKRFGTHFGHYLC